MKNSLILFFLFFFFGKVSAQVFEGTPCTATCLDAKKTSIIGRMPPANGLSPNVNIPCGGGSTEDNPAWWIFRPSGNTVTFSITTSNCIAGGCGIGVSLTIFEGTICGDVTAINCITGTTGILTTTVTPGKIYYLQLDGVCETQCDVVISYIQNQILQEVIAPTISGPLQICKGATTTYSPTFADPNAAKPDDWKWTLSPASAGTITKSIVGADVKLKITNPPVSGKVSLCLEPIFKGKCPPKVNAGCIELTIPADNMISESCNIELCPRQLPFTYKLSDCLKTAGIIPATFKVDMPAGTSTTESIQYTVQGTNCSGTLDLNINVKPKSDAFLKQLPALILCQGDTKTIKGRTFSCADAAGSPVQFLENEISADPLCDTIFEMVVQCIDIVPTIVGKATLDCNNNPMTLDGGTYLSTTLPKGIITPYFNSTGNRSYQWRKDGIDIGGANNAKLIVNSPGNYELVLSYAYSINEVVNGVVKSQGKTCSKIAQYTVTSNAGEAIAETPIATADPCKGAQVTYFVKPDPNAQSYKWTVTGTAQIIGADTDANKLIVKNDGIIYDVCLTKKACGKQSAPSCITVVPNGLISTPLLSGLAECQGDSSIVKLANASNYSSNARYSWKITGGSVSKYSLDSLQVKIKWKNGATDRKVKLLVSDFCGKDSTTVNVISTLPATIKSNSPVCTGLILLLEANGGINYIWEGPNGFTWEEKNVKIGNMSTMEAGIYTVTVSATSGCSAVVKTTVVVAPLPSTVKSNSPVCLGNTLQLNAVGGTIYQWSGPNNFSSNLQSPEIKNCTQAQNGTYTVTVSDASGCSAVLETKVEIAAQINPIVSANLPVCTGNVLKLKASGGTFYKWEGPNGFKSDLQNPEISNVAMIQSGTYTVTVSNTNGCSGKGQTIVNVLDVSGIMAVVKNNGPVCVGDTVKLTVSGGASYKWSGPAGFSSTNDKINILNAAKNLEGSYVVTVTGSNGCSVTTQTSVKINALPLAVATCNSPVCIGSDVNFLGQGGLSYLWTGPANFESTLQNPTLTKVNLNNSGTYSVVVTDANKCKNTATVKLEVKTCISTKDGQSNSQIKVFPNPAKDRLNISATSIMKWVEISNIAGQKIMERALNSSETVLDVSELIDGDYFLKVYLSDKNFEVFKIIIKD